MSGSLTIPGQTKQTQQGARLGRRGKENLVAYLFLLPWLAGLFIFTLGPIIASAYLSFTNYDLLTTPEWNGLFNYERLLTRDDRYATSVSVTARYVFLSVPLQLIFALLVAAVLNRGLAALSFYRAIYYLPSLLGGSVA